MGPLLSLGWGSVNSWIRLSSSVCEGPERKYVCPALCPQSRLQPLPLLVVAPMQPRHCGNEWAWLCSNKTLLIKAGGGPGGASGHSF